MKVYFLLLMLLAAGCSGAGVGGTSLDDIARECELFGWSDEQIEEIGAVVVFIARTGVAKSVWEGTSKEMCLDGRTCGGAFPDGPPADCPSSCVACIDMQWSYGCERAGDLCSGG